MNKSQGQAKKDTVYVTNRSSFIPGEKYYVVTHGKEQVYISAQACRDFKKQKIKT